jgi:hypothetical protein
MHMHLMVVIYQLMKLLAEKEARALHCRTDWLGEVVHLHS